MNALSAKAPASIRCSMFLAVLLFAASAPAAIIYSGVQNVVVPLTLGGVYVNPFTNATAGSLPGDWNTAPWMNPFLGGTSFSNGDLLLPVIDAPTHPVNPDTIVNMAFGSMILPGMNYTGGENTSTGHTAAVATPNKFTLGTPGYIGFEFKPTSGGSTYYGWAQVLFSNTGSGSVIDWAYNNLAGEGIVTGQLIAAPEPARAVLILMGMLGHTQRRRRHVAAA